MSTLKYEGCPRCISNGRDTRRDNLVIYPDGSAHCFSCKYHVFPKYPLRHVIKEINNVPKSLLPFDFTRDIPKECLQWLLQWELPYSYWLPYIGYSESSQRLVFRVGEPLQFSIGRYFDFGRSMESRPGMEDSVEKQEWGNSGDRPNRRPRKWYVWGDCHRHAEVYGAGRGDSIILVEDLISAHKVGQLTEAIPLFGTEIHTPVVYYIMNSGKPVKIWLDKDQEWSVRNKAAKLQSITQTSVDIIVTDKDPKEYSLTQLKEITNGI